MCRIRWQRTITKYNYCKQGKKIAQLEDYVEEVSTVNIEKKFENVVGQDSLTRFDQPKKKSNNNNKRKKKPFKKNEQ